MGRPNRPQQPGQPQAGLPPELAATLPAGGGQPALPSGGQLTAQELALIMAMSDRGGIPPELMGGPQGMASPATSGVTRPDPAGGDVLSRIRMKRGGY